MQFEILVREKITDLSSGQKKVAQYILGHLEESSYLTLTKISREAGVSETTVVRFAYAIGFESFSSMQAALQKEILGQDGLKAEAADQESAFYDHILNKEIMIIEKSRKNLQKEVVNTAVEKLHMADLLIFTESNRDETGINTVSSITAMLNILAVGLRKKDPKRAMERLKLLETLYLERKDVIFE